MRTATAKGIIQYLEKSIFLVFGVPDKNVSDNGSQFISKEYKTYLKTYRVEAVYVFRYHPQANAAEAANKTYGTAIRGYIKDNHREWDRFIPQIACAMNSSQILGVTW